MMCNRVLINLSHNFGNTSKCNVAESCANVILCFDNFESHKIMLKNQWVWSTAVAYMTNMCMSKWNLSEINEMCQNCINSKTCQNVDFEH